MSQLPGRPPRPRRPPSRHGRRDQWRFAGRRYGVSTGVLLAFSTVVVAGLLATVLIGVLVADRHKADRQHGGKRPGQQTTADRTPTGPRTWYVAADTGGVVNGSRQNPFTDVQAAIDVALPGDTIRVGPGHYPGGLHTVRSGTPTARIRLVGQEAHLAAGEATHLIEILHSYIDLAGFDLVGGNSTVRLFGARRVRILNNVIREAEGECVRLKYHSQRNEVAHNYIHGCGQENFDPEQDRKNGEAIYIGTAPEQLDRLPEDTPDRSDYNWIHDNRLVSPAECVDVKEDSGHTLVERNLCSGGRDPDGAGFSFRGDHGTLRANTVRGGAGAGIRLGGDGETQGVNTTVVGNVVVGTDGYGVKVMRVPQAKICGNEVRAVGADSNDGPDPTRPCA